MFVWGGDGMVQRCVDALAGTGVTLAILPAGTANLFAAQPRHPQRSPRRVADRRCRRDRRARRRHDQRRAVRGDGRRRLRRPHDPRRRRRPRRTGSGGSAYVWTGSEGPAGEAASGRRSTSTASPGSRARPAACCSATSAQLFGGIRRSTTRRPDDGLLEVGVITAEGLVQWARTVARTAVGAPAKLAVRAGTKARKIRVKLDRKMPTSSTAETREGEEVPGGGRAGRRCTFACLRPRLRRPERHRA